MTLEEKILLLCKNPVSIDELSTKLNMSLFDLQSLLIDLQLDEKIEQNNLGDWITISECAGDPEHKEPKSKIKGMSYLSPKAYERLCEIVLQEKIKNRLASRSSIIESLIMKHLKNNIPQEIMNEQEINDSNSSSSSQKGCPIGYTRATFIIKENFHEKIQKEAYWDRLTVKEVMEKILNNYFKDKEQEEIIEESVNRINPQLSCTITQKDQELLNALVVYFTNKEGKPVNTSEVIRILIRFGSKFKDQLFLKQEEEEFRMTLRVPESFVERLDEKCKSRTGNISRNQMIVEILDDNL